ncbi:hypothetical protein ATCC90586_011300 [Pythium insidiosum]|nr:hypothetical protein ATCC90586_011300 [Pythium insidiosum]
MSAKRPTGATRWKAPECMDGESPTAASDWFAFGMTVLEAESGRVPWANVAEDAIVIDNVRRGKLPPRPANVSDQAWELVAELCKQDARARLAGKQAISRLKVLAEQSDAADASTAWPAYQTPTTGRAARMEKRVAALDMRHVPARESWFFLGDSGVGKTTLFNLLSASKSSHEFGHGFQRGVANGVTLIDTPGLSNAAVAKEVARKVIALLQEGGRFKLFFILRFQPSDVIHVLHPDQ